ncbi:hypothetical protein [[Flexibacter] sp. ATCC 35208]|uniref:hypothetical protein n=1 Tax=[Flexibacter] sp. ATCC 35208 TaxID=1936242 RepID=UPI0009CA0654|nr:hypothetical protein [[Flexibacter] sp. ATCC 35208]OMP74681.1 hypothetical protein BW716_34035 [[Flexibacter] sp. ATCC 35208]
METLAIKEFISIYQYAVFSRVRAIFNSLEPNENEFGEILVKHDRALIWENDNRGLFVKLLENSNLEDVIGVLRNFYFVKPQYLDGRFVFFGRDSNLRLDIGLDLSNGKVIIFDNIEETYAYIADSERGFLNYLRLYLEYTIISKEINSDYSVSLMFRNKVIEAVGKNYASYYRFIFTGPPGTESTLIELPFKL